MSTQTKTKFTRGPYYKSLWEIGENNDKAWVITNKTNWIAKLNYGYGKKTSITIPEKEGIANADIVMSAFNAATVCEESGLDGQACIENLPNLIRAVNTAVIAVVGSFEI